MEYAIFLDVGGDKPQILGTRDGTEIWKESLSEIIDFIKEYDIHLYQGTYIAETIREKSGRTWVIKEYRKDEIEDMLANGIPQKGVETV